MNKRIGILLIILLTMFVLVGWGKKEVKLLGSNKLIDLSKAIELAKPGGKSGESEEKPKETSDTDTSNDEETTESGNYAEHDSVDKATQIIIIRIRGEQISYTCGAVNIDDATDAQLEDRIRSDYVSGAQLTLIDDFAEAHKYKSVRQTLDELKKDIGLEYKEGPNDEGSDK